MLLPRASLHFCCIDAVLRLTVPTGIPRSDAEYAPRRGIQFIVRVHFFLVLNFRPHFIRARLMDSYPHCVFLHLKM
jgi:hypothetical protein